MAVGLACLQTVLDQGNVDDWFDSSFIIELSLVSVVQVVVCPSDVPCAKPAQAQTKFPSFWQSASVAHIASP